jgi:DNA polymerase-3 subunit delta'
MTAHAVCYIGENLDEFAQRKAQAILCGQAEACGDCLSCRKVQNKSHPDLIWVHEKKIAEIRDTAATAYVRPNDGEFKVYIFTEADKLSALCQNALLKFIEEPPDYVRIIFTARSADMLLETVKSRLMFMNTQSAETVHNAEHTGIADAFMNALNMNSEYKAAAALSQIKTRDELSAVLDLISAEIRKAMHNSQSAIHDYAKKQEFLQKSIDDLIFNPNIALMCSHIASGIMEV